MSPATELVHRRCLTHPSREAVARCTDCQHDFCRECVTEHGRRMVCGACLERRSKGESRPARKSFGLRRAALAATALLVAWGLFYLAGQVLLLIPPEYHAVVPGEGP